MSKINGLLLLLMPLMLSETFASELRPKNINSYKALVIEALERIEASMHDEWEFKVKRESIEDGIPESSIELYSPNLSYEERWKLLRVNDAKPTKKQQQSFQKRMGKYLQQNNGVQNNLGLNIFEVVNIDTLTLTSKTTALASFSFEVNYPGFAKEANRALIGTLFYDINRQYVSFIEIKNRQDFSPAFSVSVSYLYVRFDFALLDDAIVNKENYLEIVGKVAFISRFEEISRDKYYGYKK
ncbi:hypothetical protein [Alteromonas facilis]|uniref:hypothetical protein n=1 Tax=Alteromonas facilis TaxID=2048004 RepID=UPI000C28EB15|nr:hypothetical protein [Alteromonas facilis]